MVVKFSYSLNSWFVVKAKINSMPDCNCISSWPSLATKYYWFSSDYKNTLFINNSSFRIFFSVLNIITGWEVSNLMIVHVPLMAFFQSNILFVFCWALPILHTLELNLGIEVVRNLLSDCPHLKCSFAGVLVSVISQVPHYLLQFHGFILRKNKDPSLFGYPMVKGKSLNSVRREILLVSSGGQPEWVLSVVHMQSQCACFSCSHANENLEISFLILSPPSVICPSTPPIHSCLWNRKTHNFKSNSFISCLRSFFSSKTKNISKSLDNESVFFSITFYSLQLYVWFCSLFLDYYRVYNLWYLKSNLPWIIFNYV